MRDRGHAQIGQPLRQPPDVAVHDGAEVGVHHRGRKPLEFSKLRCDHVRNTGKGLGEFLGQDAGGGGLVRGRDEAVQEADSHRFDPSLPQRADGISKGILVQGHFHRPVMAHAFRDLQSQIPGHQRGRLIGLHVV